MPNQEAITVARTFVENLICRHGVPEELVTDQGTNFMGQVMKSVCKILKIRKINTSAYHPQANLVERANRELKTYLRQYVMGDPYVWDNFLPYFSFEYNTTVNSSTRFTPHELLYGHAARLPLSIYKGDLQEANYHSYALEMRNIFKRMHGTARANLVSSKVQRKESTTAWQSEEHTTGLMNLPDAQEADVENRVNARELYERYERARSENTIDLRKLKFVRKIVDDPLRYRIVILNSRTSNADISRIWTPPHGLKDYTSQGVLHVPEAKIVGVILEGKSTSLVNSEAFLERFQRCLSTLKEVVAEDQEIPILSFRRIKQFEVLEMIQFAGEQYGLPFSLYNASSERIEAQPHEVPELLREFHDAPLGGHVGAKRMRKRLASVYQWKSMKRDIEDYVRKCESCQKNKICKYNRIPMRITTTAAEPFEKVFMDIVVLPETARGNRYGLVIQDDLTRFLIVAAMPNQEAITVARTFVENLICRHGVPEELVTDQGTNFMGQVMKS
uniref:RNA-directed DNA polymerase n=1 Tax=Anopheles albimanus TaxID=7167 RepID=A0A182F250_ANOAL